MKIKSLMQRYPYIAVIIFSTIFVLAMVGIFFLVNNNFWIVRPFFACALAFLYACMGGIRIWRGVKKLRQARSNQEQIIWYRQASITLGLFFIIAALWYIITLTAISILPEALESMALWVTSVVFGIPALLLLILSAKYRQKNPAKP
jgi:hypothetical protein